MGRTSARRSTSPDGLAAAHATGVLVLSGGVFQSRLLLESVSGALIASGLRVLVVIVASGGHVIQKVIELAEPLGASDLRQAANYLNEEFSGLPLYRAREAVLERINAERSLFDALRQVLAA